MAQMNFGNRWRQWINSCISSAKVSFLINGSPTSEIQLSRGLRQGDPFSPFLFIIVAEDLSVMVKSAVEFGFLFGISLGTGSSTLSLLQYADDTLLFCQPQIQELINVHRILNCFALVLGLKVNFNKSALISINVNKEWIDVAATSLWCKTVSLPVTYLGLPIGTNPRIKKVWDPVLKKIKGKLASWKTKFLSFGGRLTLIKACLNSLPIYYLSLFRMPKSVGKTVNSLFQNFFWGGTIDKKKICNVKWDLIQLPKTLGGLGVGCLLEKNKALLFKWLWRIMTQNGDQALC